MSLFTDASLVMIPSGIKDQKVYSVTPTDGSGDLTFSRASNATRVNSSGLVEKVRENQYYKSTAMVSSSLFATYNVTPTSLGSYPVYSDSLGYSYTITGTNQGFIIQLPSDSSIRSVSVYLKDFGTVDLYYTGSAPLNTISDAGTINGYKRYVVVLPAGANNLYFRPNSNDGTPTTCYSTAPQIEYGDIATAYISNDTTASVVSVGPVSGLPRLDYSGGASCPSLLLEPQRTNLVTFSEKLDGTGWAYQDSSITSNATTSPDGYANADAIIEGSTTFEHNRYQAPTLTAASHTASVFLKKYNATWCSLYIYNPNGSKGIRHWINLDTLTAGTSANIGGGITAPMTLENYGNGWVRASITFTADATEWRFYIANAQSNGGTTSYAGDGTSGLYAWGAQIEAGAFATSYIGPTLSSAVTRVGEASYRVSASAVIGQTEGTLFIDLVPQDISGQGRYFGIVNSSTTADGWIAIMAGGSNNWRFYGDGFDFSTGSMTRGTRAKVALAYKNGVLTSAYVNGVSVGTLTANTTSKTYNQVQLGYGPFGNTGCNDTYQAIIFPTALSNAQLAELTA